jgi:hypothetical protein
VTAHKFKSSPVLGSSYVIRARLLNIAKKQCSLIQQEESWIVDMVKYSPSYCKDGLDPFLSLSNNNSNDSIGDGVPPPVKEQPQVYNTAIVTIASRRTNANHHCAHAPPTSGLTSRFSTTVLTNNNCNIIQRCDVFTIHRDEFDIHLPNAIPMRTVLNLFERQRSNWLGGPHVLKQMLTEYNLQWVVTSIDDLEIHTATSYYSQNDESSNHKTNVWVKPGMEVEVRSSIQVKRRGMILEFQQQVVQSSGRRTEDDNGDGVRNVLPPEVVLAQGVVTICAIDGKKGRPTRDIPPEVKRILSI